MRRGLVHLTRFSDDSLRLLIDLACHPGRLNSADQISRAFGISRHHLVRVVQTLTDLGVVVSQRGRGGGNAAGDEPVGNQCRLADPPLGTATYSVEQNPVGAGTWECEAPAEFLWQARQEPRPPEIREISGIVRSS